MNKSREIYCNLLGITIEQFEQVLKLQNGRCAICGCVQNELVVDFIHKEKRIRGLLCEICYNFTCQFDATPELLRKAALYLEN